jgi:hypothetical protein
MKQASTTDRLVQNHEDAALSIARSLDRYDSFFQDKQSRHISSYQEALYGTAQRCGMMRSEIVFMKLKRPLSKLSVIPLWTRSEMLWRWRFSETLRSST